MGEPGALLPVEDLAVPVVAWRGWSLRRYRRRWGLASVMVTPSGRSGLRMRSRDGRWFGKTDDRRCYWPPGGIEARCRCVQMNDQAPGYLRQNLWHRLVPGPPVRGYGDGSGCGVYAMKTFDQVVESHWFQSMDVVGTVELGGRIWEHGMGYRAQHARVRSLVGGTYRMRRTVTKFDEGVEREILRSLSRRYNLTPPPGGPYPMLPT